MTELPHGWTRRRLRFDAKVNPKKSLANLDPLADVSFVPMDAVGELGTLDTSSVRQVAEVYDGYTYFADDDVCLAKITPCFENGKGALAADLTNGVAFGTTELHVIRATETIDPRFLFYVVSAYNFRKIGASEMLGAGGQKRVPERFIKDWMPPLPPLDTQRRIVRFLDAKTTLIDSLVRCAAGPAGAMRSQVDGHSLCGLLLEYRDALVTAAVTGTLEV